MIDLVPRQWLIATFKEPVVFNRGKLESWYLNPVRRYVFNAEHLSRIAKHVEATSSLNGSPFYKPLYAGAPLQQRRVLVERFRDRGLGDHLFLTGPFAFLKHISGGDVILHAYAFSDRGQVFLNNPALEHQTAFIGPTHYDDFSQYDFQWMVDTVTECSQETDQLNVYDVLYSQIGINPAQVDPRYKRPYIYVSPSELSDLASVFYQFWNDRHFDVRKTGYYVVAPLTHSKLRAAPYALWVELCRVLARRRPVLVVGQDHEALPDLDMSVGAFFSAINGLGDEVINLMNIEPPLPLRSVISLIAKANCLFTLDTGPLYIAQGLRTPAISFWGPHHPGVRIGYDPEYMDLAIWNERYCTKCPCYAYGHFPAHKCPHGSDQALCEVLAGIELKDVLEKLEQVERRNYSLGPFKVKA